MENEILKWVEDSWSPRFQLLQKELDEAVGQVEEILALEQYHREGHQEGKLRLSLGGFGSQAVDVGSLASLLRRGDKKLSMEERRFERVQKILQELKQAREAYRNHPPKCRVISIEEDLSNILRYMEEHFSQMSSIFTFLRRARLEAKTKYHPQTHDDIFANFKWTDFSDKEIQWTPPFVILLNPQDKWNGFLPKLLELLSSERPVKVLMLQTDFGNGFLSSVSAWGRHRLSMELLPIALRDVYLLQTAAFLPQFQEDFSKGLASPRPALFSIFGKHYPGHSDLSRAERALSSRTFPYVAYDPDRSSEFVKRFDLSQNPQSQELWPKEESEYLSENGEVQKLEQLFTFADFAMGEDSLKEQFTPVPSEVKESSLAPVATYLTLSSRERARRIPYVCFVDAEKHLRKSIPSQEILSCAQEKLESWKALQEIAGVENPYVQETQERVAKELRKDKELALQQLREEMQTRIQQREQEAVHAAMKNLVLGLLKREKGGASILASAPPASFTLAAAMAVPVQSKDRGETRPIEKIKVAPPNDLPWVETKLCTSCDECTTMNKNLFAYDGNKQAYIKDPRGGPFKDLVRAAEKCSAGIIHPGKPLDPKEKDLEKWIQRAEKYQ